MRDVGIEKILRDINLFAVSGGSTSELKLFLFALQHETVNQSFTDSGIAGFLPNVHPLSPFAAFTSISRITRFLVKYNPQLLWEQDTAMLPKQLRKLRKDSRNFAESYLRPLALKYDELDLISHDDLHNEVRELLVIAAKKGILSDLLPKPLGSSPILQTKYSLALKSSIKTEELARVDGGLMLLLSAHHLGMGPILISGDLRAILRLLPIYRKLKRGEPYIFAFAITEPEAGSDVEESHGASVMKPGTIAKRVPGGWVLNGRKQYISGGAIASAITLFAALEGEGMESWTCFLVTKDMPGLSVVRTELKMGMRASDAAEIELVDVFVPNSNIIGGLRGGWAINRAVLNLSRIPVGSMAVGFAQAAVDITMDFVTRETLGRTPLIHFQEYQLALADMIAETSAIRQVVWENAKTWHPTQRRSAISKFYCSDRAVKVVYRAIDIISNRSIVHQQGIEKVLRDVRLTQIFEGTNQINRLAVIEDTQDELLQMM
ncbi:MAG: acyl-CoA/acyl-ACP dehydrogenase [Candidatus Heimdallarchaeota archaeon]|nr:acyl-CoA/acyl-ACP dehydrogenase [Candidatus Heimdallarchaeota archaeon]